MLSKKQRREQGEKTYVKTILLLKDKSLTYQSMHTIVLDREKDIRILRKEIEELIGERNKLKKTNKKLAYLYGSIKKTKKEAQRKRA